MTMVDRVGEELARQLNRRQMLKRAAVAIFGVVAAWTVEGFRGKSALAQQCGVITEGDCTCNPPEGVYCSGLDETFCAGAQCDGGCTYDESYRYAGACWCSATCRYEGGESGYYQCCDCDCYGQLCACREFISTGASDEPAPQEPPPDSRWPTGAATRWPRGAARRRPAAATAGGSTHAASRLRRPAAAALLPILRLTGRV